MSRLNNAHGVSKVNTHLKGNTLNLDTSAGLFFLSFGNDIVFVFTFFLWLCYIHEPKKKNKNPMGEESPSHI